MKPKMFDFLKPKREESQMDVKTIRHKLVQFIKEQLQRVEGGEGIYIKGIQLYLAPAAEDKHLYQSAIFEEDEERFKSEEIQKIADDYAIALPPGWILTCNFTDELPAEAVHAKGFPAALHISTNKRPAIHLPAEAYISVLNGVADEPFYKLTDHDVKVCIGRDRQVQTDQGFIRINQISFPGTADNEANKFISRQHAHIAWNKDAGQFFLYADEGGIPPKNKIKVQTAKGDIIRLQATSIGHPLQEGDQIILGASALLQFSYRQP